MKYKHFVSAAGARVRVSKIQRLVDVELVRVQLQHRQHHQGGVVQQVRNHTRPGAWEQSSSLDQFSGKRMKTEKIILMLPPWPRGELVRPAGKVIGKFNVYLVIINKSIIIRSNYGGEYQFIFAERDDSSCHHCVHFFVRTVNIIEKKESKFCWFINRFIN